MSVTYAADPGSGGGFTKAAKTKGQKANQRFKKTVKNSVSKNSYDYLAAIPPAQLQRQVRQTVQSQINPYLAQINKQFGMQQKAGLADITAANRGFVTGAEQYTPMVQQSDAEMLHGQQLLDQGIRQFLAETGQNVTQGVLGQQQAAGAPVEALAATQAQTGGLSTGIQGEALGQGASTMSRMLSQKAADVNYGNLLPNVARAQGTQDVNLFTRNITQQRSAALGDVTQQVPGLVATTYQNLLKNEVDKQVARQAYQLDQQKAAAGPAQHLQLKPIKNPDGSIDYVNYDPATGAMVPAYHVDAPKGTQSKDFQKRLDSTTKEARKMALLLYKGYNVQTPTGGAALPSENTLLQALLQTGSSAPKKPVANIKAYGQVIAMYKQNFPNQPESWVMEQARLSLVQGGYAKADRALSSPAAFAGAIARAYPNQYGPKAKTVPGGPATPSGTPPGPKPPRAPSYPQSENVSGAAKTREQIQAQKTKAAADAAKAAANRAAAPQAQASNAAKDIEQKLRVGDFATRGIPRGSNEARIVNYIHVHYPKIPPTQARAIAHNVLAPYYKQ